MQSRHTSFDTYADECDHRADTVSDRQLSQLFRDLATQWRALATIARGLEADAQAWGELLEQNPELSSAIRQVQTIPLPPFGPGADVGWLTNRHAADEPHAGDGARTAGDEGIAPVAVLVGRRTAMASKPAGRQNGGGTRRS